MPFEQRANPVLEGNPRLITYKYFFNRKVAFLKEADAVALFPGGFGTLDEAMETLTLVQTGKRNPLPLVLVDDPVCYVLDRAHQVRRRRSPDAKPESARATLLSSSASIPWRPRSRRINRFYSRYHSMRYVDSKLVFRLTSQVSREHIQLLKEKFRDILLPGGDIVPSEALPAEVEDADVVALPRLVLDFNRKDFGRLKSLIDAVNDF